MADDRSEGHRRIGLAEGREPHLRDFLAERFRRDRQGRACWKACPGRRHAIGGEALDVLDRIASFTHREPDILGADVVLEVV